MKLLDIQGAIGAAILLLSLPCEARSGHQLEMLGKRTHTHHKRIHASPRVEGIESGIEKRNTCAFPTDAGLVAVAPGAQNAGWAMSPDQPCTRNSFCPYACPPGQVMAQWSPAATAYVYPESMAGGLYCDGNGQVSKPFPNKPYCVDGTGTIGAQNNCGKTVSFCQTVLPGNEAMLIPTKVNSWSQLAVPGMDYWASTAAHYYINPPGVGTEEACTWSDGSKPIGNWSPYVAGANTDANGMTFVKIGYNPIWTNSWLSSTAPTFGVKIVCSGDGCNGTPCSINPSKDGIGNVESSLSAAGAGGANFCVVTVPKGMTANIVVFDVSGKSDSGSPAGNAAAGAAQASPSTSATPTPTPSTSPSSTQNSHSSSHTAFSGSTTSYTAISTSYSAHPTGQAGNFFQSSNSTSIAATGTVKPGTSSSSTGAPTASETKKSGASETISSGSIFSFIVMFVVAGYLL